MILSRCSWYLIRSLSPSPCPWCAPPLETPPHSRTRPPACAGPCLQAAAQRHKGSGARRVSPSPGLQDPPASRPGQAGVQPSRAAGTCPKGAIHKQAAAADRAARDGRENWQLPELQPAGRPNVQPAEPPGCPLRAGATAKAGSGLSLPQPGPVPTRHLVLRPLPLIGVLLREVVRAPAGALVIAELPHVHCTVLVLRHAGAAAACGRVGGAHGGGRVAGSWRVGGRGR